jgi:hypothetical protein
LRSVITGVLVAISTPPQRPSALALVLQINPISTASDNATGHRVLFRIKTVVSMETLVDHRVTRCGRIAVRSEITSYDGGRL